MPDTPGDGSGSGDVEVFFAGAVDRILKFILAISALLAAPVWWFFGLPVAGGFVAGGVVSWLNFKALARGAEGITSRIVDQQSQERGRIVIIRFLLRYVLVAGIAYAIFKGSTQAFYGFLFGVCLPAAAMLTEAAYEGYMVFRRGY